MALKFKATVDQPAWLKMIREKQRPVATAAVAALRETAFNSVEEGRRNIAGAGKFGPKWQEGLQFRMLDAGEAEGEPSLQAKAIIFHKFGIAGVFEHGATIEGKPLLWIPTQPGLPTAGKFRATAKSRRKRTKGKLVSATVNGQPMLFDAADPDRDRKPVYIGVPSVRIPKKFRITEIVKENVAKITLAFLKHFKGD